MALRREQGASLMAMMLYVLGGIEIVGVLWLLLDELIRG